MNDRGRSELVQTTASPRMRVPYGMSSVIALILHVGFIALFSWRGVWELAIFNVFSVAIFVVVIALIRKDRIPLALGFALAEVVAHQVLATHYLGWDAGFQYYLFAIGPLPLLLPGMPKWYRFGVPAALLVLFAALLVLYLGSPPNPKLGDTLTAFLGIINLVSSVLILWSFSYFYQHGAELAEDAMDEAHQRSEKLLHNILPPAIVARLRANPGVVADAFEGATILFTDLVGFTPLAERKKPEELVRLLDSIVGAFDELVEERGLEKIKTIGDSYMVASGVPRGREDHAQAMADLALAMRDRFERLKDVGGILRMRVGIHSGPVIAGVIGRSKFAYDLWGDTVNTAARMESHGEPGKIHVSEATVAALGEGWLVEERGVIEVKGKGPMRTFWLVGREASRADSLPASVAADAR